jgi:uncharacterized membrane protein
MLFKKLLDRIKRSIWLYPVLYSLGAIVLAVVVIFLDTDYFFDLAKIIPSLFLTSTEQARSLLSLIAGAFITIMTFTFSTTMVVLTMYSSQFSPRVVENFLANKATMKSFGILISGFIYAIMTLFFLQPGNSADGVISASIGVFYIIIGLVNFIVFIASVGTYIQAGNLIDRLYERAENDIIDYRNQIKEYRHVSDEAVAQLKEKALIFSPDSGYIQEIDYRGIYQAARDSQAIVRFDKVPGQFLTERSPIAVIYFDDETPIEENIIQRIVRSVMVGQTRTETQDFSFSIQKIAEVALKALSPGINDPNTAIHCIRQLGLLIRDLSQIEQGYILMKEEEEMGALYREGYNLHLVLTDVFVPIIHYGHKDILVMREVMKAYRHMLEKAPGRNKTTIYEYARRLKQKMDMMSLHDEEYELINREFEEIQTRMA